MLVQAKQKVISSNPKGASEIIMTIMNDELRSEEQK